MMAAVHKPQIRASTSLSCILQALAFCRLQDPEVSVFHTMQLLLELIVSCFSDGTDRCASLVHCISTNTRYL